MIALARDLLLFRAAPQDLPYSPLLLAVLVGLGVLGDVLLLRLGGEPPEAFVASLAGTALRLALLTALFAWRGLTPRLVKTLSALWLADLAFRVLIVPPLTILAGELTPQELSPLSLPARAAALVLLALAAWQLLVQGHILRHALEVTLALGTLTALMLGLVSFALLLAAVPSVPGSP